MYIYRDLSTGRDSAKVDDIFVWVSVDRTILYHEMYSSYTIFTCGKDEETWGKAEAADVTAVQR